MVEKQKNNRAQRIALQQRGGGGGIEKANCPLTPQLNTRGWRAKCNS